MIELLVVIGVIGILAAIILGVLPAAQNKSTRSRIKSEVAAAALAIDRYKAKHSFFPPDNKKDYWRAPLYYELTGTVQVGPPPLRYKSIRSTADQELTEKNIDDIFGIKGFLNSAPEAEQSEVARFWENLPERQIRPMDLAGVPYKILCVSRKGTDGQLAPLFYNSSSPTNNPGEFDLWAEIDIAGKTVVIGNW